MNHVKKLRTGFLGLFFLIACSSQPTAIITDEALRYPILFITQVPIAADFTTITSTFGNQKAGLQEVGRGGDVWIRFTDGSLKNLTKAAGFGVDGLQNAKAIAVRDPSVHWEAKKAIFSMVVGGPTQQYDYKDYYWQLYEITGLAKNETPVITKVANQPLNYNNIAPIYSSDDKILFTSDRPRDGKRYLYPQLDEYEAAPTVSGVWKLTPSTGKLELLDHSPSGDFDPLIDSFGRLIFTRWDHLQRDQLLDTDMINGGSCTYCAVTYASEAMNAGKTNNNEVFPEPRPDRADLLAGTPLNGHLFNHFLPWMMNQDGTGLEILNHLGRHELHSYIPMIRNDDPSLTEYYDGAYPRTNTNPITNFFQVSEDPLSLGRYLGIDAPEFGTHGAGQIVAMKLPPTTKPDLLKVEYLTHRDTSAPDTTPSANHSGFYRSPVILSNGRLIAVHTKTTLEDKNIGSRARPKSRYQFRLQLVNQQGSVWKAGGFLTSGITETIKYYDPDVLVSYSGELWELGPVEVRPRTRPSAPQQPLPSIETAVFQQAGVNLIAFQSYLRQNNLALVISRNVTVRDDADKQQPFNLRVTGSNTISRGNNGKLYNVSFMQFFQGNLIRSYEPSGNDPFGRRVVAQPMENLPNPSSPGPSGSVVLGTDGSMAALVPARRALTWQLTDSTGKGVVLERNWLTFQPGEVRVCASCHGLSDKSQKGTDEPTNSPLALKTLLENWKTLNP
jgi:Hydrazine synthase alpha subunit middle domain